MDNEAFKKISARIESYQDEMISLQRQLTAIPALAPKNDGEGEWDKMQLIKKILTETGLEYKEFNAPDPNAKNNIRPNITAVLKGKDESVTFWILSHLDVVPPGQRELWDTDPYLLHQDGDRLYGRGTEDNQQDLIASILCVKAFIEEQILPEVNIGIVIVSDEETASEFGIRYMLQHFSLFRKTDLILVPDSGNSKGDMIEIAEKTMLWLKFSTIGKQCHASAPAKGINSFRAASYLITRLDSLYKTFPKENPLFNPPISTFEPTKKESNVPNVNTIPGDDVFYIDCRILPDYPYKEVIAEVEKICRSVEDQFKVTISCTPTIIDEAAPITSTDASIVQTLTKAIKEVLKVDAKPRGIGGGTVASHFRKAGFSVAVWSKISHTAHQPNEYCLISNMVKDTTIMAHIGLQKKD